jgi:hypothetical protein
MNEQSKLILAIGQIDNLLSLLQGNEYYMILQQYLISVRVELNRQLSLLTNTDYYSKIQKSNTNTNEISVHS